MEPPLELQLLNSVFSLINNLLFYDMTRFIAIVYIVVNGIDSQITIVVWLFILQGKHMLWKATKHPVMGHPK